MRKQRFIIIIIIVLLFILIQVLRSQTVADSWVLNPQKSSVTFWGKFQEITIVEGEFEQMEARLLLKGNELSRAQLHATIQATSINTKRPDRDQSLRGENFLNVKKYPQIILRNASFKTLGGAMHEIQGELSILGKSRSVKFVGPVVVSSQEIRIEAKTTISRFDFGMTYNPIDFSSRANRNVALVGDSIQIAVLASFVPSNQSVASGKITENSQELVTKILTSLSESEKKSTVFDFTIAERLKWGRGPGRRPGLAVKDMSVTQKQYLHDLLRHVLSVSGYRKVTAIMKDQDVLGEQEEGLGEGYYWFAVYGAPDAQNSWSWRLGGHHLSLHFTYTNGKLISVTPLFLGAEQTLPENNTREKGYSYLRNRQELLLTILKSSREDFAAAKLIQQGGRSLQLGDSMGLRLPATPTGIKIASMSDLQQNNFKQIVEEYFSVLSDDIRAQLRLSVQTGDLYWSWAGETESDGRLYYRLQGKDFLIELINEGKHLHTYLRGMGEFGVN